VSSKKTFKEARVFFLSKAEKFAGHDILERNREVQRRARQRE